MDVLGWITDSADRLPEGVRALIGAVFACLEVLGLGPFFPGELAVLFLGASFDEVTGAILLITAVMIGASAGDHVLYTLGRRLGPGLRCGWLVRRIGVAKWDTAIGIVERRGSWAVIGTRMVPIVRSLTPIAAGVSRMPLLRFTIASLAGSLTWALAWGGTGYLLRSSLVFAQELLGAGSWIILTVLACAVMIVAVVVIVRRRRRAGKPGFPLARAKSLLGPALAFLGAAAFIAASATTAAGSDSAVTGALAVTAAVCWGVVLLAPGLDPFVSSPTWAGSIRGSIGSIVTIALALAGGFPTVTTVVIVGVIVLVELSRVSAVGLRPFERVAIGALFIDLGLWSAPHTWGAQGMGFGTLAEMLLPTVIIANACIVWANNQRSRTANAPA